MQIPPTTALLNALSSLPASGAAPRQAQAPQQARPAGALAAAQKALAARGLDAAVRPSVTDRVMAEQRVQVPAQNPGPDCNLPRGSFINIVV